MAPAFSPPTLPMGSTHDIRWRPRLQDGCRLGYVFDSEQCIAPIGKSNLPRRTDGAFEFGGETVYSKPEIRTLNYAKQVQIKP
jgi:hypothetical protein